MKINCSWAPLLVLRGFSGRRREPGTQQAWLESWAHGRAGVSSPARRWVRQCAFSQSIGTFNTAPDFSKYTNALSCSEGIHEKHGVGQPRGVELVPKSVKCFWSRSEWDKPLIRLWPLGPGWTNAWLTLPVFCTELPLSAAARPREPGHLGVEPGARQVVSKQYQPQSLHSDKTERDSKSVQTHFPALCPCLLLKENTNWLLFPS